MMLMSKVNKAGSLMNFDPHEDKSEYVDSYSNLKKDQIVDEARCFHDKTIDHIKCRDILTKIMFLLNHVSNF